MIRLALAGKGGGFGVNGLSDVWLGAALRSPAWPIKSANARAPNPMPHRHSSSRRLKTGSELGMARPLLRAGEAVASGTFRTQAIVKDGMAGKNQSSEITSVNRRRHDNSIVVDCYRVGGSTT